MQDLINKIKELSKNNSDFIATLLLATIAAGILSALGHEIWTITFVYILFYIPLIAYKIKKYIEEEELEDNFSTFIIDLVQYLDIGMDINNALKQVSRNSYGKRLDYEIRKMISEMEYGLTFIEAFNRMATRVRSDRIRKIISNIIETERYGGDIVRLLKNISKTLDDMLYIKRNRLSKLRNFVIVFYLIYIGLLAVVFLTLDMIRSFELLENTEIIIGKFKLLAFTILIINAIFTGLLIGKVSYGSMFRGIPHSIILSLITAISFIVIE